MRACVRARVFVFEAGFAIMRWALRMRWTHSVSDVEWDIDQAGLGERSPETDDEAQEADFRNIFQAAFFNAGLVIAWKRSLGQQGSTDLLVAMCRAFMNQVYVFEEDLEVWAHALYSPMLKFSRGVLAMCFPVPRCYGSSLQDVLYIMPDKKTTLVNREILKVGRMFVQGAAADEIFPQRKVIYIYI